MFQIEFERFRCAAFAVLLLVGSGTVGAQTVDSTIPIDSNNFVESYQGSFQTLKQDWTRLVSVAETDSDWPDIQSPGPDMGDFPNSAFTLPKGRIYLESAPLTMASGNSNGPAAYLWPYLLRYGITDDVEFRMIGNGLTSVYGQSDTTGFSPLILDMKVHLWNGNDRFIPASSLEVYMLTDWGSSAFDGGWQPSLNMNFDLPLRETTNFEVSVGMTGVQDAVNQLSGNRVKPRFRHLLELIHERGINVYQFTCQWAVEQDVTDRLQVFVHGYYNGALKLDQGAGSVVGAGGFYQFGRRLTAFMSFNAGLDSNVAPFSAQLGWAYAL